MEIVKIHGLNFACLSFLFNNHVYIFRCLQADTFDMIRGT